jgi:hypothetical protein
MRVDKIGPDQVINLIWIVCIVGLILVLCLTNRAKPVYLEVTGGCIIELAEKGRIEREGITIAWHGDTLCNPEELRVAGKRLIEMADKADREKEQ